MIINRLIQLSPTGLLCGLREALRLNIIMRRVRAEIRVKAPDHRNKGRHEAEGGIR
jgi:hypothetical protein